MHLGAHAVDVGRLYATQRILGVIGVFWALAAGIFLTAGYAQRMSYPAWQPLLQVTHEATFGAVPAELCYRVVGGILATAGILGVVGLVLTWRWLSVVSAVIGTVWCITITGFLGFSNVAVDDGGNFLALSSFLNMWVFLLRVFLLVHTPEPARTVQMYERG